MMRRRGGPGVMSTMARTAVIAGTATAVSNKVAHAGASKAAAGQQQQAAQQAAQEAAAATQSDMAQMQAQLAGLQAQQVEQAALGGGGAMMAQMQQLAQLKESGMLTEDEFATMKARLLAG